jgi:hypothetical protein
MFNLMGATSDEKTFAVPGPTSSIPELVDDDPALAGGSPMVGAGGLNVEAITDRTLRRARRHRSNTGLHGGSGVAITSPVSKLPSFLLLLVFLLQCFICCSWFQLGIVSSLVAPGLRRQGSSDRHRRISQLSSVAVVEEEFLATAEAGKLHATIAMYNVWKARCLYIYGHIDEAWVTMEKAIALRSFIAMLSMELELVFGSAMIALAKIGRIMVTYTDRNIIYI